MGILTCAWNTKIDCCPAETRPLFFVKGTVGEVGCFCESREVSDIRHEIGIFVAELAAETVFCCDYEANGCIDCGPRC